jgi:hypothetical protein
MKISEVTSDGREESLSSNEHKIGNGKKKGKFPTSWIDSRRKVFKASQERRKHPRVDCDCPAIVQGSSGRARVTEISPVGWFVECESGFSSNLQIGQRLNLIVKFPTEDETLNLKIKVSRAENRGIACELVALERHHTEALLRFLDFVKETQPLF